MLEQLSFSASGHQCPVTRLPGSAPVQEDELLAAVHWAEPSVEDLRQWHIVLCFSKQILPACAHVPKSMCSS
jgi:hypothetical protein